MEKSQTHSPSKLFLAIFLAALLSLIALWVGTQQIMTGARIDTARLFNSALPENLHVLYGADAGNGIVAEFFDETNRYKFSLAQAEQPAGGAPNAQDLLNGVIAYQTGGVPAPTLAPLLVKFTAAQFDGRRAYNIEAREVSFGGAMTPAITFTTNRGANYALAVVTAGSTQTALVALLKNAPVDIAVVGSFAANLKLTPEAPLSSPANPA